MTFFNSYTNTKIITKGASMFYERKPLKKNTNLNLNGACYQILETIGNGSSFITYTAKGTGDDEKFYVIKEFYPKSEYSTGFAISRSTRNNSLNIGGENGMELFVEEMDKHTSHIAAIMGKMRRRSDYENLEPIIQFNYASSISANNTIYYVCPLKSGSSYDKCKDLSFLEECTIVKKVAEQVKKFHEYKLIHLDIKAENIFYNKENQLVCFLDFDTMVEINIYGYVRDYHNIINSGTGLFSPSELQSYETLKFAGVHTDVAELGSLLEFRLNYDKVKKYDNEDTDEVYIRNTLKFCDDTRITKLKSKAGNLSTRAKQDDYSKRPTVEKFIEELTSIINEATKIKVDEISSNAHHVQCNQFIRNALKLDDVTVHFNESKKDYDINDIASILDEFRSNNKIKLLNFYSPFGGCKTACFNAMDEDYPLNAIQFCFDPADAKGAITAMKFIAMTLAERDEKYAYYLVEKLEDSGHNVGDRNVSVFDLFDFLFNVKEFKFSDTIVTLCYADECNNNSFETLLRLFEDSKYFRFIIISNKPVIGNDGIIVPLYRRDIYKNKLVTLLADTFGDDIAPIIAEKCEGSFALAQFLISQENLRLARKGIIFGTNRSKEQWCEVKNLSFDICKAQLDDFFERQMKMYSIRDGADFEEFKNLLFSMLAVNNGVFDDSFISGIFMKNKDDDCIYQAESSNIFETCKSDWFEEFGSKIAENFKKEFCQIYEQSFYTQKTSLYLKRNVYEYICHEYPNFMQQALQFVKQAVDKYIHAFNFCSEKNYWYNWVICFDDARKVYSSENCLFIASKLSELMGRDFLDYAMKNLDFIAFCAYMGREKSAGKLTEWALNIVEELRNISGDINQEKYSNEQLYAIAEIFLSAARMCDRIDGKINKISEEECLFEAERVLSCIQNEKHPLLTSSILVRKANNISKKDNKRNKDMIKKGIDILKQDESDLRDYLLDEENMSSQARSVITMELQQIHFFLAILEIRYGRTVNSANIFEFALEDLKVSEKYNKNDPDKDRRKRKQVRIDHKKASCYKELYGISKLPEYQRKAEKFIDKTILDLRYTGGEFSIDMLHRLNIKLDFLKKVNNNGSREFEIECVKKQIVKIEKILSK